jgi:hypothetical protein
MRSRTTRSLAVPLLMAAGMVAGLLTAAPASAMTTRACTQKGTRSNDTMTVNLTIGGTFVVCAFTGTDTINLRGTVDTTTILVIVLGAGGKTVDFGLTSHPYYSFQQGSGIVMPSTGVTLVQTGTVNGSGEWFEIACGDNSMYLAAANATNFYSASGRYEGWYNGLPDNDGC